MNPVGLHRRMWRPGRAGLRLSAVSACSALIVVAAGCGKKGPPLPPLIRIPVAPTEFTAERHGADVNLQFKIPNANTDGSRPGNLERVDVYGFTGSTTTVDDLQLLKRATMVGSVAVKALKNPNDTVEADEPTDELQPLQGKGLDQGVLATVTETLTSGAMRTVAEARARERKRQVEPLQPLVPAWGVPTRTYVAVGLTTNGRKGALSNRVAVPLLPPPALPSDVNMSYDENAVTLGWNGRGSSKSAAGDKKNEEDEPPPPLLPIHLMSVPATQLRYNVYEMAGDVPTRLTKAPQVETTYRDARMEWDTERCYVVRAVETLGTMTVESETTEPVCDWLMDTFPPAAPKGLTAVGTQGAISLIWEPNGEKDLAGYIVLRGPQGAEQLSPITPVPIQDTTFRDTVAAGVQFVYAVQTVDKAGNFSGLSSRVEESAR